MSRSPWDKLVPGATFALLTIGSPTPGFGQRSVRGVVVAAESGAPLVGAVVSALRAGRSGRTDQFGAFRVSIPAFPDTLATGFIGRAPDTLILERASDADAPIVIRLARSSIKLSAITVTAERSGEAAAVGRWQLSMDEARMVPPAVETDVFRSLTLAPSVSFTSPLSARPLIRGLGAGEASFRIDGHEVINLYHVGRFLSAFPADAAQQVTVTVPPASAGDGGALGGIVDITGRGGAADHAEGGADLSLISASAWVGGGDRVRWFGAGRVVHFGVLAAAAGLPVPYDFEDFYGSLVIGASAEPSGRVTVFGSRDHLFNGMDWSNVLVGSRWQVVDRNAWGITYSASAATFSEDAANIVISNRGSTLDVRNRFSRITNGVDASAQLGAIRLTGGGSLGWRHIANRITPVSGSGFAPADLNDHELEAGAYLEGIWTVGSAMIQGGARFDAAGPAFVIQPRLRAQWTVAPAVSLGLAAGRSAQLYHLVSDPRSEPDLAFYDFWLSASDSGVPIARADHITIEIDLHHDVLRGRVSAFASMESGLVELRPTTDPTPAASGQFRVGRGRTRGFEAQVAVAGTARRPTSLSVSYVYGMSERDWGDGWVRWSEDRRHLLRILGQLGLGSRWVLFGAFEATSGPPLTPIDQVMFVGVPDSAGVVLGPTYVYGRENSGESAGAARADLGARFLFRGPWGSRAALGLSVLNVGFGPVAPLVPAPPTDLGIGTGPVVVHARYERLFDLPPIPTVTLRFEF